MGDLHEYHTKRTALIDADYIAYQSAAWAHSHQKDLQELDDRLMETLGLWVDMACATNAFLFFSCSRGDNFRRDLYPPYKAHRESVGPPMLAAAHKMLQGTEFRWFKLDNVEADDLIGIAMTNDKVDNPVCVTRDKDLLQIPGWHLNPFTQDFPSYVSPDDADRLFYTQWLTGDSVDGFPGIKGVGPAKAQKLLERHILPSQMRLAVFEAYDKAGISEDDALVQARCARILRAEDWDSAKQEPILWGATT